MKRSSDKSTASRKKMVQAAGAAFREHGLGGIGVDGLAQAADFTSGAFYFHFKSKLDAFVAGLEDSLDDLNACIQQVQEKEGCSWVATFAAFYLGFKRTCDLGSACALPVLSSEVERAGLAARQAYEAKISLVFDSLAQGLARAPRRDPTFAGVCYVSCLYRCILQDAMPPISILVVDDHHQSQPHMA